MKRAFLMLFLGYGLCYALYCQSVNRKDNYYFSKVDYQQGLSNSAVLCLFQDNTGLMWFGTYDGVNCYDGKSMEVFKSDFSKPKTLTNNIIHSILQADSNCLWITTHLGVNRISLDSRQVVGNYDFSGDYFLHSNAKGNTWVISQDGLFYYNLFSHKFIRLEIPSIPVANMDRRAFVTDDGTLWTFPENSGKLQQFTLDSFDKEPAKSKNSTFSSTFHPKAIDYINYQNGIFFFVDDAEDLYLYDISRKSKIYIRNISSLILKYGQIGGIVPFDDDIIVGFKTNGLVRLRTSEKYEEEIVNRNIRIFDMYLDSRQGILWVASDGQGAITYAKKYSIATNLKLSELSPNLSRQVRSVMTDKFGGLWMGTKGDGLLHVPDYRNGITPSGVTIYSPTEKQKANTYIKWDKEFSVYKLQQSRFLNGFWIGSVDPGLFYYSFDNGSLTQVTGNSKNPITDIHDLYEENDSTLYIVTAGSGFHKIVFEKKGDDVRIKRQKQFNLVWDQHEITMFYPMQAAGDSILWLGSRQDGLVRFNKKTEEYKVISLSDRVHKSVNDILSLCQADDGTIYVGTTSGLVHVSFEGAEVNVGYFGREQGLLNDMIHGIVEDKNGFLWLSTNKGLIKYNPKNGFSHTYYYTAGLQIGEFSDDAYYKSPYTEQIFFGGIDGLVYLDNKIVTSPESYLTILLRKLSLNRKSVNLGDYYTDNNKALQFRGTNISFTLSFVVPEFLQVDDIEYAYMLEGYDKEWTSFSSLNEASYIDIPAGNYVFKIKYKKDIFNTEYKSFSIPIYILPPWYRSTVALIFYLLLLVASGSYLFYLLRRYLIHERMVKVLLNPEKKEADSFDPSHYDRNLLNRLTLIYRACDQLRAENISFEQREKNVNLIRESIISTLFYPGTFSKDDFQHSLPSRYFITGRMSIYEVSVEVLRILAGQGYDISGIKIAIPRSFIFPVYKNALRCILYYSFLRIAEMKKATTIDVVEENGEMRLLFSSTDSSLKTLYSSLEDWDSPLQNESNPSENKWTMQFLLLSVQSALKQIHSSLSYADRGNDYLLSIAFNPIALIGQEEDIQHNDKKKLLLLEDRDELIWLISDMLSDEYEVVAVKSIQVAFEEIRRLSPALLLVDVAMYAQSENSFMKTLNKNRALLAKTAFIPMLSWNVNTYIQRELILWSDSYIMLPYDCLFLKEVIHNAVYGKHEAKQIQIEDLADLSSQIICTTSEQADFIRKLLQVIEQNLYKDDLGSTYIAGCMAMSPRQFYRKFKEITNITPGTLVKSYRMEKAAKLLLDEEYSIQDVISMVGFSSRSYFYKEFALKFGMTPKNYREQHRSG